MTDPRLALIAALRDNLPHMHAIACVHLADALIASMAADGVYLATGTPEESPPSGL
ncbi:hypothetical protein [Streptomyces sp. NPDC090026]|uniref:hypothetical protein n=1 Tax=Streptomyces sp. NPDC090026 TaxID=3365923 RepID=UPI0038236E41